MWDTACLFGTKCWIDGFVSGDSRTIDLNSDRLGARISSRYGPFSRKAINSHHSYDPFADASYADYDYQFLGLNETLTIDNPNHYLAQNVLNDIARIYASLPDDEYDFSETSNKPVCGPVNGNNMIGEMSRVALAGESTLFVNECGLLVTGRWKDLTDIYDCSTGDFLGVDVDIPPHVVKSAKKSFAPRQGPTRVKVQGCFKSCSDKGFRPIALFPTGGGLSPPGSGGFAQFCIENPLASPESCFGLRQLLGNPDIDLSNLILTVYDSENNAMQVSGGDFENDAEFFNFLNEEGLVWDQNGTINIEGLIPGRFSDELNGTYGGPYDLLDRSIFNPWASFISQPREFNPFLHSQPLSIGMGITLATDFDVANPTRYEVIVEDPCAMEELGNIEEVLDNPYIYSPEQMFCIAVRRFQEAKMAQKTWTIELEYFPCASVNSTVRVNSPEINNSTCEIIGLITSVRTKYDPCGRATTSITVADFCELNRCEYTSPNLLFDPCLWGVGKYWIPTRVQGADGMVSPWPPVPISTASNGAMRLQVFDGGQACMTMLHPYINPGTDCEGTARSYEFTFDVTAFSGNVSIDIWGTGSTINPTGMGSPVPFLGPNTVTITPPVVGVEAMYIEFCLDGDGIFQLQNPVLTCTKVA
jgi:hypothetical protein